MKTVTRVASFQNFPLTFRTAFDWLNLIISYSGAVYMSSQQRERERERERYGYVMHQQV
jgi:hypothetical protein